MITINHRLFDWKFIKTRMFHVFRNTPLGRETLLQSIYFCKTVGVPLHIYVPVSKQFLMDFDHGSVRIDLDASYLASPSTAFSHVTQLAIQEGIEPRFFQSITLNFSSVPIIPTNFDFMCCPRSIGDLSSKFGVGYLSAKIRRIIGSAKFPVLITGPAHKEWKSIAVLFGGSVNAVNALKLGFRIGRASGLQIDIFTQVENISQESYKKVMEENGLKKEMGRRSNKWHIFEKGSFEENLYNVPHDALVVLGGHSHSPIKKRVFGSKMEKIRFTLPNNLLIAGPNYKEPNSSLPAWFPSI